MKAPCADHLESAFILENTYFYAVPVLFLCYSPIMLKHSRVSLKMLQAAEPDSFELALSTETPVCIHKLIE